MHRLEREQLKQAKKSYKVAFKNKETYINRRNMLIKCILDATLPRWGSLKISMVKV